MDSLEILAKQNLVSEKFYQDQLKKMTNGGILSYADSPPMENKFYHEARTEAEHRMVMRNGGATGITPPPKPAPPGFKRNEQQTDAPQTVEVEVNREL